MPPPSMDKSIDKPPRPPKAISKRAPKRRAEALDPPAEAPKSQAEEPKSQAEAPKSQAEAPKSQGEPYRDTYTCIYSEEVDADAANDDIDGDEVVDCAKYNMHSGQMFCFTRWACPECRRLCFQIEQQTHYKSSSALIQLYKDQLKTHLISSSRYRLN